MDAGALRDREIVSVQEAHRLGKVREVLFETQPLRVAALKASGDEGEFIIALDRVSRFGPDAVMVESPSVREIARGARDNERTLDELTHLKVVDEDGRSLGTVRSIEFDPDSGAVERIIAGESGMLGMGGMKATIQASGIRGVGTDLLTVASSADNGEGTHLGTRDIGVRGDDEAATGTHGRAGAE
ncbi:MAG TPA: PRC-barrel domain-containing protein [Candidatus Limnocylindrales bacterium]|nr:PRC-barrel domain-containing protein [Candidatus Limnocylindrales bacterium]